MNDKITNRQIILVSIVCIIYHLLTIFYYHIDKHLTGILYNLLFLSIPIAFITIVVFFVKGINKINHNRKNLSIRLCLTTIITFITLTYTIFSPWKLDSEILESKVVLRGCFEGTQNQATIKFREDKSFELHWTGVFGYNKWFTGTYIQSNDTLFLNYEKHKPDRCGDTIVKNKKSLITVNKLMKDSTQYFVPFYLGNCKGLN